MPNFFSLQILSQKLQQYDPNQLSYGIAQQCKTCKQKIIHNECISVCACYRYCHLRCLLHQLNQKNQNKQHLAYRCKECKKDLTVTYQQQILKKCQITKLNIFLLILSIVTLPLATYSAYLYREQPVILVSYSFIISCLLSVMAYAIINSCIVREYTAWNVISTHLGLMISAFMELEKGMEEQTTHTEMVR